MWMEYFKVVKIKPGRVNTALFGLLDFTNPNIPLEKITELYESDFPYLEITEKGKEALYGVPAPAKAEAKTPKPVRRKTKKPGNIREILNAPPQHSRRANSA